MPLDHSRIIEWDSLFNINFLLLPRYKNYSKIKLQNIIFKYLLNGNLINLKRWKHRKNTDVKIKCHKCGNEYAMDMIRIGQDGRNLVCRSCLERKIVQKQGIASEAKIQKQQEQTKEYFCKECRYSFKRAKHIVVSTCPYCSSSGSLMTKGSTAKIIADASKMKEDSRW